MLHCGEIRSGQIYTRIQYVLGSCILQFMSFKINCFRDLLSLIFHLSSFTMLFSSYLPSFASYALYHRRLVNDVCLLALGNDSTSQSENKMNETCIHFTHIFPQRLRHVTSRYVNEAKIGT